MTAKQFIDDWIARNPEACSRLARAAIRSYCLDRDLDTGKRFLNLDMHPDLRDVDTAMVKAIRQTSFVKAAVMITKNCQAMG